MPSKIIFTLTILFLTSIGTFISGQERDSPVDRNSDLEKLEFEFRLSDGPSWDGYALTIPDVLAGKIVRYIPSKDQWQTRMPKAGKISATYFNHGRHYLADNGEAAISWIDRNKKIKIAGNDPNAKPAARPNDLVVDNRGGIYYTLTGQKKVMYIDRDGNQSVAVANVATPNGIILSLSEKTLYVSAYVPKEIWAYSIESAGKIGGSKKLCSMDDGDAKGADGMAIDRAGNIYCAGANDIWIWNPKGELLDRIRCPVRPINCTFGDQDMRTLYISTMKGLYRQRMLISGRSATPINHPNFSRPPNNKEHVPSVLIPDSISAELDVAIAKYGTREILADVLIPESPKAVAILVHGGGWAKGDKTKFRALSIELAKRDYLVVANEYRLADEAPFPAAIQDCFAAVRFVRANAKKYGVSDLKIFAVGGSAGGHLAGLMASGARNEKLIGDGGNPQFPSHIDGAIVMAGPLQIATGNVAERSRKQKNSNANRWLRTTIEKNPKLFELADAHRQIDEHTCPILFMTGEFDSPKRNEQSRNRLQELGISTGIQVYPGGKHGCWNRKPYIFDMVNDMDTWFEKLIPGLQNR